MRVRIASYLAKPSVALVVVALVAAPVRASSAHEGAVQEPAEATAGEVGAPEHAGGFGVPDMPDPHAAEWEPPPAPPAPPAAAPAVGIVLPSQPSPTTAQAIPTNDIRPSRAGGRIPRPPAFYAGIVLLATGAVAGGLALRAREKARAAQEELTGLSNPIFEPELREAPLAEIEKQNRRTLAFGIAFGALTLTGLVVGGIGLAPKRRPTTARQSTWIVEWGIGRTF